MNGAAFAVATAPLSGLLLVLAYLLRRYGRPTCDTDRGGKDHERSL